jgi:hypothetical protein
MIVLEKSYQVRKSGIENEGVSFGIKKEGLAHIFNVLRNQLYSNKILAVVREYSCNAYDAHVEAGVADQKFIVTCPTFDDPSFSVRDFGSGLSPEGIAEVYAYYGESTKRQSNALIGQLGLGSKSGFAYGDNFVIKSYHDGTLYTYNAFLDESKIGQILLMNEEPTSENNGVEIVIPVKIKDLLTFKETIAQFFKHFKNKPIVKNIPQEYLDEQQWKLDELVLNGDGWSFLKSRNSWDAAMSVAVMGNVAYPINGESVEGLSHVFHTNFIVEFGIGELEVAASREALQFSTVTQNAIKKRFKSIMTEVDSKIKDKITNAKSLFEAKAIYNSLTNSHGDFYRFKSHFNNISWNNQKLDDYRLIPTNGAAKQMKVYEIVKSGRSERIISKVVENKIINCTSWARLYVDDTKGKFMPRLAHYVFDKTNGIQHIYVISFENDVAKKTYLSDVGMEEKELVYTSSEKINKIVYPKGISGDSVDENPKHISSEFKLDLSATHSWYKIKSDQFKQASFNLDDGGVYLYINRFYCKSYFDSNNPECMIDATQFIRLLNLTNKAFKIDFPEIACFKEDTAEKVAGNPKWKSLKKYVEDYISVHWTDNQSQKLANYVEYRQFTRHNATEMRFLRRIKNITIIKDFSDLVESFNLRSMNTNMADELIAIFERTGLLGTITANLKPTHSLEIEFNKIKDQFEIFKAINWYEDKNAPIVEKYLQLEEKSLTAA